MELHRQASALIALLALGCATSPVTLTYTNGYLTGVDIQPKGYGRTCYDISVEEQNVRVTVVQDGTSDWAGVRVVPILAREVVIGLMSVVTGPIEVILAAIGAPRPAMAGPSKDSACSAVFED